MNNKRNYHYFCIECNKILESEYCDYCQLFIKNKIKIYQVDIDKGEE
jgi:rRNA maturation endonuclease Nob1